METGRKAHGVWVLHSSLPRVFFLLLCRVFLSENVCAHALTLVLTVTRVLSGEFNFLGFEFMIFGI